MAYRGQPEVGPSLAASIQDMPASLSLVEVDGSILQATRPSALRSFSELSIEERNHLREWHAEARDAGIDGVEDLAARPWPAPPDGTVIGVFTRGSDAARWLVIGQNRAWAVADCTEGQVSRVFQSLPEALATIYPG